MFWPFSKITEILFQHFLWANLNSLPALAFSPRMPNNKTSTKRNYSALSLSHHIARFHCGLAKQGRARAIAHTSFRRPSESVSRLVARFAFFRLPRRKNSSVTRKPTEKRCKIPAETSATTSARGRNRVPAESDRIGGHSVVYLFLSRIASMEVVGQQALACRVSVEEPGWPWRGGGGIADTGSPKLEEEASAVVVVKCLTVIVIRSHSVRWSEREGR